MTRPTGRPGEAPDALTPSERFMVKSLHILAALLLLCALLAPAAPAAEDSVDLGIITVKQKQTAEQIRQRLIKGEPFEELAKANSVGPAAFRGGRLGRVPMKRLRSEYRQAIAGLKPGVPSQVVLTEEGYTILEVFGAAPAQASTQAKPNFAPPGNTVAPAAPRKSQKPEEPRLAARREVLAGLEALVSNDSRQAEQHFSQALGMNPAEDSASFLLELARYAGKGKVKSEALKVFAQGFLDMTEAKVTAALRAFRKSRELDPGFWQGMLFEANMLAELGRKAEAQDLLKKVLTLNPKSARANLTLGLMAMDAKEDQQAQAYFKKAVELNPYLADAHYQLSTLAMIRQDLPEAERQLKATLALNPYMEEAHNDLGLIYFYTNRRDLAAAEYAKASQLNPNYPAPHVNLGNLYAQMKEYNRAIDEYNKALNMSSELGEVHVNLAAAYILQENWPLGIEHADKALRLGYPVPQVILKKLAPHRK